MASQTPEMDEIWKRLSIVLDNIFRLDSLERKDFISQKDFKDLYNIVANYFCQTGNEFENLHLKYSQKSKQENETIVLPGVELYSRVTNLFRNYLQSKISNNNGDGEIFLEFYAKTWEVYQKSSHIANCILGGLHKSNTVRQQINDANRQESQNNGNSFNDIYTVAMHIWQDIFFKDSNQSLTKTCLKLITKERDGERINARLIKQVVDSYVSAGFTEKNAATRSVEQTLLTYNEYFEKIFLEETKRYYTTEVTNFPAQNSTVDYARKVYQRFDEEENRVKNVLHEKTMEKVQTLLIEIFIENQIITLQEELIKTLRREKIDEIALLFNLVNRIPSAHKLIIEDLKSFAKPECLAAIQTITSTPNRDPKTYCEKIIIVYSRFSEIVEKGFCNHQSYRAALDEIFGSVVNNNAVTQEAGRSTRSAELLAAYFDVLLKKGNKLGDLDIEEKFNQLMIIFNYIEDKDAFLTFYGKRLARRLVNQLSASDDFEEAMILKLKDKCGFEYTSKLQQMFKDIRLSEGLIEKYKENCQNRGVKQTIDLYVMVLSSNSWPFVPPAPFNLPTDLRPVVDSFTNFHTTAHAKRKLEWLYQYCKGELQTLFTKQKYILQVSTYQMTILLLFNSDTSLTVDDIFEKTKIDVETLLQVLLTLLKPKILICSQINPNDINDEYSEKNIQTTYEIHVNENFKSPKLKINLNIPLRAVEKRESDRDNQQIDEGRKFVIQAAIVRTMKARQILKHSLLMQEVIQQLSSRFQPKVPMIKKCIDNLIEKEYLERQSNEKDVLRYLA